MVTMTMMMTVAVAVAIDWCHFWSRHDESCMSLFQDDAEILQRMMRSMKRSSDSDAGLSIPEKILQLCTDPTGAYAKITEGEIDSMEENREEEEEEEEVQPTKRSARICRRRYSGHVRKVLLIRRLGRMVDMDELVG